MKRNTLNTFITATLIMLLGVSSTAQAMVPANSRITSTSTLTLDGLDPLTATVTVTVNLQRSKPLIALKAGTEIQPNPSLGKWIAGGDNRTEELTYTYTITTTANGPADYTVEADLTEENLDKVRITKSKNVERAIRLGATAVLSVEGNIITVPSDGKFKRDNDPTTVNGIRAGDKVVINKIPYVVDVDGVDDSDGKTATITLDREPGPLSPGDPIAEQATFTVTLDEVVLAANAPEGRAANNLTVTASQAGFDEYSATSGPQEFLVILPRKPKMKFYVRNVFNEGANPASDGENTITYPAIDGNTYFETDLADGEVVVNADPGDTLEYLVMIRAGNDGPLTAEPYQRPTTDFLVYVAGTTALNAGEPIPDEGIKEGVLLSNDADQNPNVIDTDQTAYVTYQMTVIGGDGGDGQWATNDTDCSYNMDTGLWKQDSGNDATKCKGVKWNAANGIDVATNPVCWANEVQWDSGANPWVVGTAAEYNSEGYDCRTKCAGQSGESLNYCAADGWWENEAAYSTMCGYKGSSYRIVDVGGRLLGVFAGVLQLDRADACK